MPAKLEAHLLACSSMARAMTLQDHTYEDIHVLLGYYHPTIDLLQHPPTPTQDEWNMIMVSGPPKHHHNAYVGIVPQYCSIFSASCKQCEWLQAHQITTIDGTHALESKCAECDGVHGVHYVRGCLLASDLTIAVLSVSEKQACPAVHTVAKRALILLDWLNHPQQSTADAHVILPGSNVTLATKIKQELVRLLHRLLRPHLSNPGVHVDRVFFFGIPALMTEWVLHEEQNPWLSELCTMLMLRAPEAALLLVSQAKVSSQEDQQQLLRCCDSIWWIVCECYFAAPGFCL